MAAGRGDFSLDIYRRIYRLGKQGTDSRLIAATLKMPLKTVRAILEKLFSDPATRKSMMKEEEEDVAAKDTLSVFIFTKPRYAVVDLGGTLVEKNVEMLLRELDKLITAQHKAIAIRLTDVHTIDDNAITLFLDYKARFAAKAKYLGLLDPSQEVENLIYSKGLDEHIPIFGTERAFEENAFKVSIANDKKKKPLT